MLLIDRLRSFFRQVLKRIFKQDFRSLQLMLPDFKLCKRNKETLTECSFAKLYQCPFIVSPSSAMVTLVFFKIGCFDKTRGCRVHIDEFFKYDSTLIKVALSLLKLKVGVPCELRWLPSHPVFKNLPNVCKFAEHFFH